MANRLNFRLFFLSLASAVLLAGCAAPQQQAGKAAPAEDASEEEIAGVTENDPAEGFNRAMFRFNEVVDRILLKPVATAYVTVVPEPGRRGVHNFLSNLTEPVVFVNSVLQGDPKNAFTSLWRFVLNTTLGAGGIFDFASANTDLKHRPEDFGQTMGVYGVKSGPYLVLPVLGPSSARDFPGQVVDWFTDPFNYAEDWFVITRTAAGAIDSRAENLDLIDEVYRTSLDPYATIRSAYLQKRAADIRNTTRNAQPK